MKRDNYKILLVDPEDIRRSTLSQALERRGYLIQNCPDGYLARSLLKDEEFDLVVAYRHLTGIDGLGLLKYIRTYYGDLPVIILTDCGSIEDAVTAVKMGAEDYLVVPFHEEVLIFKVSKILEHKYLQRENIQLHTQLAGQKPPGELVGQSEGMKKVYELIRSVAPIDVTVLIYGESGTGKELVARAIHQHSSRKGGPFIKVSCSIFVPTLLESELFGHEKGAFTGAIYSRAGRFEQAKGGTLFLDDIDDLSMNIQTKLLRVLQDGEIERVGGSKVIPVDVRVVVASKRSLKELIEEKKFRNDLFYRINVVPINLPPLRERTDDIPMLVYHFLAKYCKKFDKSKITLPENVINCLKAYPWPGNVRELENTVKRLTVLCSGTEIHLNDLPEDIRNCGEKKDMNMSTDYCGPLKQYLKSREKEYILNVLHKNNWAIGRSARDLGISRKSLWEKMKALNIKSDITRS